MTYLTTLTERYGTYSSSTTITIATAAATNPVTGTLASVNEFDIFINGQYIDKILYTWTPAQVNQTIIFDTNELGYTIEPSDTIVVKGRWA